MSWRLLRGGYSVQKFGDQGSHCCAYVVPTVLQCYSATTVALILVYLNNIELGYSPSRDPLYDPDCIERRAGVKESCNGTPCIVSNVNVWVWSAGLQCLSKPIPLASYLVRTRVLQLEVSIPHLTDYGRTSLRNGQYYIQFETLELHAETLTDSCLSKELESTARFQETQSVQIGMIGIRQTVIMYILEQKILC
jgi:hypothetical protein